MPNLFVLVYLILYFWPTYGKRKDLVNCFRDDDGGGWIPGMS